MKKNIVSVFLLSVLLTLGACSLFKETATKLIGEAAQEVEALQLKEYELPAYAGMNCEVEAAQNAADFEAKVLAFFKLESQKKSFSGVVKPICEVAVSSIIPSLITNSGDSRPCLRKMGGERFREIGLKGCALIKD